MARELEAHSLNNAVRTLAAALGGEAGAVEAVAEDPGAAALARRGRATPALALRAKAAGVAGEAVTLWHRDLLAAAARHQVLRATLEDAARTLAAADIAWAPLKGFDVATRVYDVPEERPTADLDLLIRRDDLRQARRALEAAGFRGTVTGPRRERYLEEEGYAWPAASADGVLLELHFRLWGAVPDELATAFWETAQTDPELPPGGHRLALADAYILAAVHAWLVPPPRDVLVFRDLERLGAHLDTAEAILERTRRFGLALPVLLAAETSAQLWGGSIDRAITVALASDLRPPEHLLARRARRRNLADLPFADLQTARLLAGCPSRHGLLRTILRRLWPHPGIVETSTPETWSWPRRRLWYGVELLKQRFR